MKKVLVLAAAIALFATPSFALIANTAHDLSVGSTAAIKGTIDEICVYCHTPHGATAAGTAPLWNRSTVAAVTVYVDPAGTMDAIPTLAAVNASDAILCLSCHDGAGLTAALTNPPNSGGAVPIVQVGAAANLDTDLSNDHPIGFTFASAIATDTELHLKTDIETTVGMEGALSYGAGDSMWCSSCHDVHGTAAPSFLRISNVGSDLCLTCHIK